MKHKTNFTAWILAAPILLGTTVFFAVPLIIAFWYTFTFGAGGGKFMGIANYISIFKSKAFQLAAYNTARFLFTCVPLVILISFIIALLLHKKFKGTKLFRSILLFPMAVPLAGVVMTVQVMLSDAGIINGILERLNIDPVRFLNSEAAFWVLVWLYVWKNCGYMVILMLAGLNMIPTELYQIAAIEGANALQKMQRITLPLFVPTLFFVFVMGIVNTFKTYREAFLLSGKYPHDSIYMLQHFINNNFENLNYQRLSIASILVFAVIFLIVAAFYRFQQKAGENAQ